jgi:phosphoribosyl 1,2-cyclic phosphodiesterase
MKVKFWGTRGSIPVSMTTVDIRRKLRQALLGAAQQEPLTIDTVDGFIDTLGFDVAGTYGGHSSCLQLVADGCEPVILDMGSGARPLAQALLAQHGADAPKTYHVFMSHVHWDHIMGFPFFTPIYLPGHRIIVHACHPGVEAAFRRQHGGPSFPVEFAQLAAQIEFDVLLPGHTYSIAGYSVSAHLQRHAGDSYGWRFERAGKSLVYSTDSEHQLDDEAAWAGMVKFFGAADAVVFDAMYSLADAVSVREDWGHSSNIVGVELCQAAGVKKLVMFHHEPAYDDAQIEGVLKETRRFEEITRTGPALEVLSAWDGLELVL